MTMTCKDAEKMVMPYINNLLGEEELEDFLYHVQSCESCREELEIYYILERGLRQLDADTDEIDDITGALEASIDMAQQKIRISYLRKIALYAVNTLCALGIFISLLLQIRIWVQNGGL